MNMKILSLGEGLGDCFLIQLMNSLGNECNILVDGRTGSSSLIAELKNELEVNNITKVDYVVITHIDYDHIGGIIKILELPKNNDLTAKIENAVFIYNYFTTNRINYKHAEILEKLLIGKQVITTGMSSYANCGNEIMQILSYSKRCNFDLPKKNNAEMAYMTLIHPDDKGIDKVRCDYMKKSQKGQIQPDGNLVNDESIAFLLEFDEKKVLFCGDGTMKIICEKFEELKGIAKCKIDVIKIPHHGAYHNNKDLVSFANDHFCKKFIVTGERKWSKTEQHPDKDLLKEIELIDNHIIYTQIDLSGYPGKINISNWCKPLEI